MEMRCCASGECRTWSPGVPCKPRWCSRHSCRTACWKSGAEAGGGRSASWWRWPPIPSGASRSNSGAYALLVYLNYRVVPDGLVLVLRPKGRFRVPSSATLPGEEGWSELTLRWRVVELWTVPVERLLATREPGLMPWAPLAQFAGAPE